jgi:hypothetical protein
VTFRGSSCRSVHDSEDLFGRHCWSAIELDRTGDLGEGRRGSERLERRGDPSRMSE